jgi:hypothetical protein
MSRRRLVSTAWIAVIAAMFGILGAGNASADPFYYQYRNQIHQSICIGLQGSTGPNVVVGRCDTTSLSQQWIDNQGPVRLSWPPRLPSHTFDFWQVKNRQTNNCLGVTGGSTASGARLVVGPCQPTSDHSQLWAWKDIGVCCTYALFNAKSGHCIGTQGSSLAGGTPVLQGTCSWTDSQSWLMWAL